MKDQYRKLVRNEKEFVDLVNEWRSDINSPNPLPLTIEGVKKWFRVMTEHSDEISLPKEYPCFATLISRTVYEDDVGFGHYTVFQSYFTYKSDLQKDMEEIKSKLKVMEAEAKGDLK